MRNSLALILAISFLAIVILLGMFTYGAAAQRYRLYPYAYFDDIEAGMQWFMERQPGGSAWYYAETQRTATITDQRENPSPALNLITSIGADDRISVRVIDMNGATVHGWNIDWWDIWPDPQHVRPADRPKSLPGGHIHGIAMLDDGSIVFNFEKLAMVRMGLCGELIWKLPYRSHHSMFTDQDGNLWASGLKVHEKRLPEYPNHAPPVHETTVIKVSPDGEILREISVFDLLADNGLRAWLQMGADKKSNIVGGDALHLNDVELFPADMDSALFSAGDIMLSMRNINAVLVVDPDTLKIKYWKTGGFIRQHDPDFIDNGKISVFDNSYFAPEGGTQQSRIVIVTPETNEATVRYTGSPEQPFYTKIMGKQQWLPNGDILLTDSVNGRAIQVDPDNNIVWEFVNIVADGKVGLVEEVQRLPASYTKLFTPDRCVQE